MYVIDRGLNPYFWVGIQKRMSDDEELPLHEMASSVGLRTSSNGISVSAFIVQFSISCKFSYSEGGM